MESDFEDLRDWDKADEWIKEQKEEKYHGKSKEQGQNVVIGSWREIQW